MYNIQGMAHTPINQHYLPRVYLNCFSDPEKRVWVYDKETCRCERKSTKTIACEHHLYTNLQNDKEDYSIENWLGQIETKYGRIIPKVRNKEEISVEEKRSLAQFIATQKVRVPASHDKMKTDGKEFLNFICKSLQDNKMFPDAEKIGHSLNFTKEAMWYVLFQSANAITPLFADMFWRFVHVSDGSLVTSDNPVFVLAPENHDPLYGVGPLTGTNGIVLAPNLLLLMNNYGNNGIIHADSNESKLKQDIKKIAKQNAKRYIFAKNKIDLDCYTDK